MSQTESNTEQERPPAGTGAVGAIGSATAGSTARSAREAMTVLFVCPHGAGKSRLAAAFFNAVAPVGWWATSAGQHPAAEVNASAIALVVGTPAGDVIDHDAPRPMESVPVRARTISIDCDVPGAECWTLDHQALDADARDELRIRAETLARSLVEAGANGGLDA